MSEMVFPFQKISFSILITGERCRVHKRGDTWKMNFGDVSYA